MNNKANKRIRKSRSSSIKKNANSKRSDPKPHKIHRWVLGVLISLILFVSFLFYGPYDGFRTLWITTAMHTSDHKYLATKLFSLKTIDSIMAENGVEVLESRTDPSQINVIASDTIDIFEVHGSVATGKLLIIHDPSRVSVRISPDNYGFLLEEFCRKQDIVAAINASAYKSNLQKGFPLGMVISDGKITNEGDDSLHSIIGLDDKSCLILGLYSDQDIKTLHLRDAVEYGPFLIINGEKAEVLGNGGGMAPRTAIGQTKDGAILLLVIDGRKLESMGATMYDVQSILYNYGAANAACLDGGSSVSMFYNGSLVNSVDNGPDNRLLPNAIIVKPAIGK